MSKNKLKIITILMMIILTLTIPIVRAEDEIANEIAQPSSDNVVATTLNEDSESINSETNANIPAENIKEGDVYLTGDDITIDYYINGNLFVFANSVNINSQIAGDAFICANTVTVGDFGYVFNNLFAFSKNVNVNGIVYNLYSASENTTINGYVFRDLLVSSDTVSIFGTVGRNANINCANLNIAQSPNVNFEQVTNETSLSVINGNLTYSSSHEASIPSDSVKGEINFKQETSSDNTIQQYLLSLGTFLATVIVIWLICLWIAPKLLNKASLITTKKVLPVIGFGILTPFVGILLAIILFILGITVTLGFILLITLFILMAISTSIFIININTIICDKLKFEKTLIRFGMLIACTIVIWLIGLIPYIGSILGIIAFVLGLGIIISSIVLKEKVDETH